MSSDISDLQKQIWALNDELSYHLAPSPEFRNQQHIEWIEERILELESELNEIRGNS